MWGLTCPAIRLFLPCSLQELFDGVLFSKSPLPFCWRLLAEAFDTACNRLAESDLSPSLWFTRANTPVSPVSSSFFNSASFASCLSWNAAFASFLHRVPAWYNQRLGSLVPFCHQLSQSMEIIQHILTGLRARLQAWIVQVSYPFFLNDEF